MGQRLDSLRLTQGDVAVKVDVVKGMLFQARVPPVLYLEILQLAFWPLSALGVSLAVDGVVIVIKSGSRKFLVEDDLLIEIRYGAASPWEGVMEYRDVRKNNSLIIKSKILK